jgi:hypothetical protein
MANIRPNYWQNSLNADIQGWTRPCSQYPQGRIYYEHPQWWYDVGYSGSLPPLPGTPVVRIHVTFDARIEDLEEPVVDGEDAHKRNVEVIQRFHRFFQLYVLEILDHEERRVRALLRANPSWTWRAALDSGTLGGVFYVFAGKPIWLHCVIASDKSL